jgi:hypothetical protein
MQIINKYKMHHMKTINYTSTIYSLTLNLVRYNFTLRYKAIDVKHVFYVFY